jgi:CBS domain-containing protein
MARYIRELMTPDPTILSADATAQEAAMQMKRRNVGDVLVQEGGHLVGIVTDRDLVVRCLAEDDDARSHKIGELCSRELCSLGPDASIDDAVRLMQEKALRRIPIVEDGSADGIVSLGDLAEERDPKSALGRISAAPPNA